MVRKNFYISLEQDNFLANLDELNTSEHIRRAIDEYIKRIKAQDVSSSSSERSKNG